MQVLIPKFGKGSISIMDTLHFIDYPVFILLCTWDTSLPCYLGINSGCSPLTLIILNLRPTRLYSIHRLLSPALVLLLVSIHQLTSQPSKHLSHMKAFILHQRSHNGMLDKWYQESRIFSQEFLDFKSRSCRYQPRSCSSPKNLNKLLNCP